MDKNKFEVVEPLRSNRWLVKLSNTLQNIPEYVFSDFKLETEKIEIKGKTKQALKLTLHCYNTVGFLLTPDDVIDVKKIKIDFLDPTGVVLNYYNMNVELEKMSLMGDYGDSSLLTHELVFWVKNLDSLATNQDIKIK
jgi:hypothetical protein